MSEKLISCTCGAERDDCVDCMRDEIERLETELQQYRDNYVSYLAYHSRGEYIKELLTDLTHHQQSAAEAMRERCAQLAIDLGKQFHWSWGCEYLIADRIRSLPIADVDNTESAKKTYSEWPEWKKTFVLTKHSVDVEQDSPQERDNEILQDLLLLVLPQQVPLSIIKGWDDATAEAVTEWAGSVHFAASDNDVEIPHMPDVLRPFTKVIPDVEHTPITCTETYCPKRSTSGGPWCPCEDVEHGEGE